MKKGVVPFFCVIILVSGMMVSGQFTTNFKTVKTLKMKLPQKPDLQVIDISVQANNCRILLTIRNNGPDKLILGRALSPNSPMVELFRNGHSWGKVPIRSLDRKNRLNRPGGTATGAWPLSKTDLSLLPEPGSFRAFVDSTNKVPESNESNNSFSKTLSCIPPTYRDLPDLEVKNVFLGSQRHVYVVLRNNGPGKLEVSDFSIVGIQLWRNGQAWGGFKLGTSNIDPNKKLMNPGSELLINWGGPYYFMLPQGSHEIKAVVDQRNDLKESNENNNVLTRTLE